MIKVITNNYGSGDWIIVKEDDEILFEGHRVSPLDLVFILQRFTKATILDLTDEEMEEGVEE
jgi:hypothetical protein